MKFWAADVSVFCVNIYWERESKSSKNVCVTLLLYSGWSLAMQCIPSNSSNAMTFQVSGIAMQSGMECNIGQCVLLYSGSSRLSLWQRTAFRGQVVAAPDMSFNLFSFSVKTTWVLNTFTDKNIHSARWSSFSNNWEFMKIFWPNFSNPKL